MVDGALLLVDTEYNPATRTYTVMHNGSRQSFDAVYPPGSKEYAANNAWFKTTEPVVYNGENYVKDGFPNFLEPADFTKAGSFKGVSIFTDPATTMVADMIYLPSSRGGEFQPYQREMSTLTFHKIYYDETWQVTTENKAAYYRHLMLNAAGKPVGKVRDFSGNGTLQWDGYISHLDPKDNNNDVMEGVATWYHPSGKKAEQVYLVQGKREGLYKAWDEDGKLIVQTEYKDGLMHGWHYVYDASGKLVQKEQYSKGSLVR